MMVLALLLVLLAFGLILKGLSSSAYREVDVINQHLRAVSVGESTFAQVVSRLSTLSWSERWFKGGADFQADMPIAGGYASYVIQDAARHPASPDPLSSQVFSHGEQADLYVRATYRRSTVLMFWRLTMTEDSLDMMARIVPACYTFTPQDGTLSPSQTTLIGQRVNAWLGERDVNRPITQSLLLAVKRAASATQLQSVLGFTPPAPVLDGSPTPESPDGMSGSAPPVGASGGLTPATLPSFSRAQLPLLPSPPSVSPLPPAIASAVASSGRSVSEFGGRGTRGHSTTTISARGGGSGGDEDEDGGDGD